MGLDERGRDPCNELLPVSVGGLPRDLRGSQERQPGRIRLEVMPPRWKTYINREVEVRWEIVERCDLPLRRLQREICSLFQRVKLGGLRSF